MPATANNSFDGRIFAKLVALFDSPQEPEAAGALHRVRMYLKQHGGLKFYQAVERDEYKKAVWEAFGQPACLQGYFARKDGASNGSDELLREVTQLERKVTELAGLLTQEKELTEGLRHELAASRCRYEQERADLTQLHQTELGELRLQSQPRRETGLVNGVLVTAVTLTVIALLVAAAFR